jgi:hypothetical protein
MWVELERKVIACEGSWTSAGFLGGRWGGGKRHSNDNNDAHNDEEGDTTVTKMLHRKRGKDMGKRGLSDEDNR